MAAASDSNDASDIFWPGYVDAVTNLAINLLFVIAVMSIVVISTIMLEDAAKIQLIAEAAGQCDPEFPSADIEKLQRNISEQEQFVINFDYLARRVKRGG